METAGVGFLIVGVGCLVGCPVAFVRARRFLAGALKAQGEVIGLEEFKSHKGRTYGPIIRYQTQEGSSHVVPPSVGFGTPEYQVGDSVDVLYDPENPEDMRIDSFLHLWLASVILGLVGSVFTLLGCALILPGNP